MDEKVYQRYLELAKLLQSRGGLFSVYLAIMTGARTRKQFDTMIAQLPDHTRLMREDIVVLWKMSRQAWGEEVPTGLCLSQPGRELLFRPVFANPQCTLARYYRHILGKGREKRSFDEVYNTTTRGRSRVLSIKDRGGRGYHHFSVRCAGQLFSLGVMLHESYAIVVLKYSDGRLTEPVTQAIRSCAPLMELDSQDGVTSFVITLQGVSAIREAALRGVQSEHNDIILPTNDLSFERLLTAQLRDLGLPLESVIGRVVKYNPMLEHHFPKHPEGQWSIQFPTED